MDTAGQMGMRGLVLGTRLFVLIKSMGLTGRLWQMRFAWGEQTCTHTMSMRTTTRLHAHACNRPCIYMHARIHACVRKRKEICGH